MSDSQDELLSRPATKRVSSADSRAAGQRPKSIPTLDQIVQQSKQKDLADLLIKIIQTNEAEENSALHNYDADVSSATLRDIDAKLSAVLEEESSYTATETPSSTGSSIPMLTEIAEFPVSDTPILEFPTARSSEKSPLNESEFDDQLPDFEFPATSQIKSQRSAANSDSTPVPANQGSGSNTEFCGNMDKPDRDLQTETRADLAAIITPTEHEKIELLVEQHTERVRAQLDIQIEKMKHKLLAELLETSKKDA